MIPDSQLQSIHGDFAHLKKFVDRVDEYQKFESLVERPVDERDKSMLAFFGNPGMGKSMLLHRLQFECKKRNIANALIPLDQNGNDPTEIMRSLVNQLCQEGFEKEPSEGSKSVFKEWIALEKFWSDTADIGGSSQPGSINITAEHAEIHGDAISGTKIVNSQIYVTGTTRAAQNPQHAQNALTETFLQVLGEFIKSRPVILMFDALDYEELSESVRKWLIYNLINKTRGLGGRGVLTVVATLDRPNFDKDPGLQEQTARLRLNPLGRENIVEYFLKREISPEKIASLIDSCLAETNGIPLDVMFFAEENF